MQRHYGRTAISAHISLHDALPIYLDAMRQAGAAPRRLVPVGGGTTGDLWTQIVSDVTGLVQELPRETTGAAYGDAMLAALDRKSTRLNSSHVINSYAVFCLKIKTK